MSSKGSGRSKKKKRRERAAANRRSLAELLIAHHLRLSVADSAARDRLIQTYRKPRFPASLPVELMERGTRCIAVVGAGASHPLLSRGNELADELEREYGRDEAELHRLQLVHNLEPDAFETRLIALSKTDEAARRVRDTISEKYDVEHPTLLTYELLAHLLKHRFLDAIISFNFDELLDRSLADELAAGEYARVVSERDCRKLQTDPYAPDYVPLYVKLHGTASEPDSLRFTSESYYSIPRRVLDTAKKMLHTDHCVIANVGFGLASFDFHSLLGIPRELQIFNLSRDPVEHPVCEKIRDERKKAKDPRPATAQPVSSARPRRERRSYKWLSECNERKDLCDVLLGQLTTEIETRSAEISGKLIQFKSVERHEVVARLLGPATLPPKWASEPEWWLQERINYSHRRTILELAFAGAKGRGLLSLGPLAVDRPARYYEEYQRLTEGKGDDWAALCSAAGLVESGEIPDVLVTQKRLRASAGSSSRNRKSAELPHEVRPGALAKHVLKRVKNPGDSGDRKLLKRTLRGLQESTEVEYHVRDDRVCSKAFDRPLTLPTATALEIYTWLMLKDLDPKDRVYVSDENGDWLTRPAMRELLLRQEKIKVLLAFDEKEATLRKQLGRKRVKTRVINPWRHNRHMVIVCDGDLPQRAIYFARRLRSPVITPVYLEGNRDARQLKRIFDERWREERKKR
jgi:hypothetical protein